jgi:hypothetical protein
MAKIEDPVPRDMRRQWLHLSPDLVEALTDLARAENLTLEALLISLINEALVSRLQRRG